MSLDNLTGRAGRTAPGVGKPGGLVAATIATTPAVGELVDVLIGGDATQRTPSCKWTPVVIDGALFTPARDDPCFVQQARKGETVVVWWEPGDGREGEPVGSTTLPTVTSLPGSPGNGQPCNLLVNSGAQMWQLVYDSASSRWYCGGGSFYRGAFDTTGRVITATGALADVPSTTAGLTVPFAGRYDVEALFGAVVAGAAGLVFVGATGVTETALSQAAALSVPAMVTGEATYTASQAIKPQAYRATADGAVNNVRIGIRPVYLT